MVIKMNMEKAFNRIEIVFPSSYARIFTNISSPNANPPLLSLSSSMAPFLANSISSSRGLPEGGPPLPFPLHY